MGFNVMRLGIPVPYFVNCVLTDTVGTRIARTITDSGEFYSPEQLLDMGMVDSVVPIEEVIPKSLEKAHLLGALPQKAFATTKSNRVEKVKAQVSARLAEKERGFVECWFSDEARKLLREAMEKF